MVGERTRLLLPVRTVTATALVVAGLWAYAAFSAAAEQSTVVESVAIIVAAPVLAALIARVDFTIATLAVALVANAGLVLNAQFGVPNVVRGLAVMGALLLLVRPDGRACLLQPSPIVLALVVFALVRIGTSAFAPQPVEIVGVVYDLAFGVVIVAVLRVAGMRSAWTRITMFSAVGVGAILSLLGFARELGFVASTYGFAEYAQLTPDLIAIAQRSLAPVDVSPRIGGPLAEPNFWAQILVLLFPIALWCAIRGSWRRKAVGWAASLSIGAEIIATESRGGVLALGVAITVFLVALGGRARRSALLVPVVVLIALVASGGLTRFADVAELSDVRQAQDKSLQGRASENLAALEMFRDHALTGVGAGNFAVTYSQYSADIGLDSRSGPREPHNSYLEMAAESGLLGFVAFVALFAIAGIGVFRASGRLAQAGFSDEAALAQAVCAGFAGYATAAIFLHQGFPHQTWLALGLCAIMMERSAGLVGAPFTGVCMGRPAKRGPLTLS